MKLDKDLLTKEKFMEIVGKKIGEPSGLHYEQAYERFNQGRIVKFNWAAFIWGPTWLCYRHMFSYALILIFVKYAFLCSIGLIIGLGELLEFYNETTGDYMVDHVDNSVPFILFVVERICFGCFGNYIYMFNITRRLKNNFDISVGTSIGLAVTWYFASSIIYRILNWCLKLLSF